MLVVRRAVSPGQGQDSGRRVIAGTDRGARRIHRQRIASDKTARREGDRSRRHLGIVNIAQGQPRIDGDRAGLLGIADRRRGNGKYRCIVAAGDIDNNVARSRQQAARALIAPGPGEPAAAVV